jgi:hypothetical protein
MLALALLIVGLTSCSGDSNGGDVDRGLISTTASKALSTLQDSVAALGTTELLQPIEGNIGTYRAALNRVAQSFPDASSGDRKSKNLVTYVGMSLATLNAAQAAGGIALTGPYASESAVLDELLKYADKHGVKDFKSDELTEEASRLLERLGEFTVLGDKALTDKVIPEDSPLRTNWDKDKDGKFEVPLPPAGLPGVTSAWQDFTKDLTFERDRGSLIGRILLEISYTAEKIQLRLT